MFKMNARRCLVIIKYNDKDISADLQQYLKNVSYTDNMSGEADDLQLTLEDKAGLWQSSWMPEKGATLDVSVKLINWQSIGEQVVRFGLFEIDEITSSGMPSEVQIKAVSVPDNNNLRGAERTRSWEKAELKRIANDIATEAGLALYYDVKEYNPVIDRAEQTEQSDLSFLYKLCADHGLALKICDKQVVIFDEADYETFLSCGYVPENYRKMHIEEGETFKSLYFMNLDKTTDEIIEAAKNILEDKECGRVFRVKGFLKDEAGEWLELNATHQEMRICPIPEGQEVVIVIGEELNEERIQQYF